MELKEGMYIRINGKKANDYFYHNWFGIKKIEHILAFKQEYMYCTKNDNGYYFDEVSKKMIEKASFDILDLIEEGDLLEIEYFSLRYEERVTKLFEVTYLDKRNIVFENSVNYFILRNKEFLKKDKGLKPIIKRIITKEQLDSVAYRI